MLLSPAPKHVCEDVVTGMPSGLFNRITKRINVSHSGSFQNDDIDSVDTEFYI
jgi:hypothetical protein